MQVFLSLVSFEVHSQCVQGPQLVKFDSQTFWLGMLRKMFLRFLVVVEPSNDMSHNKVDCNINFKLHTLRFFSEEKETFSNSIKI